MSKTTTTDQVKPVLYVRLLSWGVMLIRTQSTVYPNKESINVTGVWTRRILPRLTTSTMEGTSYKFYVTRLDFTHRFTMCRTFILPRTKDSRKSDSRED